MRLRRRITSIKPPHAADRFFGGRISLVDVRSDREHMTVRAPGAVHLPLRQLHRRIDEIRTDRPVALLCRSGHRSAIAARMSKRHGLDAMSVAGGMGAWLAADLPVVWPTRFTPERHSTTQQAPTLPTARGRGRAVVKPAPILTLVLSIAILASAAPFASRAAASASEEQQGAQLLDSLRSGKQTCSSLSSPQFELIGEYVMGTMLGSTVAHEAMNAHMTQAMGAAGESSAHEYLGRRFAGCTTGAAPSAYGYMMGMWGSYAGPRSGGGSGGAVGPGMMSGSYRSNSSASGGGWSTADTMITALIGLALAGGGVALLARARRRCSPDPPDILRGRLAKGEITAEEYERTLRALAGTP